MKKKNSGEKAGRQKLLYAKNPELAREFLALKNLGLKENEISYLLMLKVQAEAIKNSIDSNLVN